MYNYKCTFKISIKLKYKTEKTILLLTHSYKYFVVIGLMYDKVFD